MAMSVARVRASALEAAGVAGVREAEAAPRPLPCVPPAQDAPGGVRGAPVEAVAAGEACRALGLKPRELELAVELGEIGAVAAGPPCGRGRRIPAAELARLRAEEGFPATLRERLRLVGAREGAELLGVSRARFARLARTGCVGPVRFSLNRYRAVVWFYLATELRDVAGHRPDLLRGPLPEGVRRMVARGEDRRPRHWRNRRIAQAVRRTDDPWAAAAAHAAVLAPDVLAEAVPDPAERARLEELRPALVTTRPDSPAAGRVVRALLTADGEEEVQWHRLGLAAALGTARAARPLPHPEEGPGARCGRHPAVRNSPSCITEATSRPRRS